MLSPTHIPMHFELNHTSPCAAFTAADREFVGVIYPFRHTGPIVHVSFYKLYCCLPFVTFVIGRPLHDPLRQPSNVKDPSKPISHPPPMPSPVPPAPHSQLIKVRQHEEPAGGRLHIMNLSPLIQKENRDFHLKRCAVKMNVWRKLAEAGGHGGFIW